ncbi:MAG TPA: hypothetical protein VK636_04765 [Gemmatimonadaceae bacterium]|nr:hypothetical protein [Gemmatimonadaceae bacterium]
MPTKRKKSKRRRSTAVPLSIVPALAALVVTGCSSRVAYDPCESASYNQIACDSAVVHHGYWYGGSWYPRTYPYLPLYYFGRYNSYVAGGGRVRSISPTVYSPSVAAPSRANVVRGGFGGIGAGHGSAGS